MDKSEMEQLFLLGQPPDEVLVEAAKAGDRAAWSELARRHYAPLLRFIIAQVGDEDAAADLVQQTFLDAFRKLPSAEPTPKFAPWLNGIAHFTLLPWMRQKARRKNESIEAMMDSSLGAEPRALDEMSPVEERDQIDQTLRRMSPLLREALLLQALAGFKSHEIGRFLGISDAAGRRVGRARSKFRELYSGRTGN